MAEPESRGVTIAGVERVRRDLSSSLGRELSSPTAALARALVLGPRGDILASDSRSVRASGLAHVLAISGMHVGLAVLFVYPIIAWLTRRASWVAPTLRVALPFVVCTPLPSIVAVLSGNAPSAWRAAVMLTLALGIRAAARRALVGRLLALAFTLLFAWDARVALSLGSALSFLGAWALVSMPSGEERGGRFAMAALASLRPLLATLPLSTFAFGEMAPAAFAANLVLGIPFAFLLLPLMWIHSGISYLGLPLVSYSASAADAFATSWYAACAAIEHSFGLWLVGGMETQTFLGLGLLCVVGLAPMGQRWFFLGVVCGAGILLSGLLLGRAVPDQLRLHSISVGQGDAHLVQFPDQRTMLIDVGSEAWESGQALRVALRARRLEGIDVVVVTHAHPDHWGGLPGLASEFSIREIWLPDPREREDEGRLFELARALSTRGVWVRRLSAICGRLDLSFGEAQLRILSPCGTESESWSANERSTVIEIEYAQRRYLFTGDIEAKAERSLLERHPDLRADVLKVAHHGSNTSSGSAFLMAVQPRVAIVPCGLANRFGHPHSEVLERLGDIGSRVLRTDQSQSLILEQRGADLYFNP